MLLISSDKNICSDALPGDVPSLHTLVRQLRSELLIEKLGRQKAEAKVKDLLRRLFGPKSERMRALQGLLFGAASAAEHAAAAARDPAVAGGSGLSRLHADEQVCGSCPLLSPAAYRPSRRS